MLFDKKRIEGELIPKTVTDAEIDWKGGFSLEKIKCKKAKLEFKLGESKLSSFSLKYINEEI